VNIARSTTSMVQRNILADLNAVNAKLSKTQEQAASGRAINRPSDNPFGTAQAITLQGSLDGNQQYQSNITDARGWQDATEAAMSSITQYVQRAQALLVQGSADTADQTSRNAAADELDQIIQGIKTDANSTYNGSYIFGGTATSAAPYTMGADDTYKGDMGGSDPSVPGVLREIGPGVTLSINSVGADFLGNGQPAAGGTGDDKLLNVLRDVSQHLRAGDGASLRGTDMSRLDANLDDVLAVRARNGAQSNRLDAAMSRLQDLETATTKQLSDTQDADFTKTIMDLNTQSAAYQAALRAGATIVQSSLMDFLK
jgi:flagellar hook-associated protein 3 FlgL